MENKVNHNSNSQFPVTTLILGILGVALVVLKLTGFLDCSWFWVTLPFWGIYAVVIAAFVVLLLIELLIAKHRGKGDDDANL